MKNFRDFNLSDILERNLEKLGYAHPTEIQEKAIPLLMQKFDLLGIAQTGTGKTAAFSLPLIHDLIMNSRRSESHACRALILAPTRELVAQIEMNLKSYLENTLITCFGIIGGVSRDVQVERLKEEIDIIVATPGRLMDLQETGDIDLSKVEYLVLDEADMMLDMGFFEPVLKITQSIPKHRQTVLFSATMPKSIEELAGHVLKDYKKIEITPESSTVDKIQQEVYTTLLENKIYLLLRLVELCDAKRIIVFCKAKYAVAEIVDRLVLAGEKVQEIHSNRTQAQRNLAIEEFSSGVVRILVATDIAARGIDIDDVDLVINYDMPEDASFYVHRIGRTARAGKEGQALSLCAEKDIPLLRNIENLIKIQIPRVKDHPFHFEYTMKKANSRNSNKRRNSKNSKKTKNFKN